MVKTKKVVPKSKKKAIKNQFTQQNFFENPISIE